MNHRIVLLVLCVLSGAVNAQEVVSGEAGRSLDDAIRRATWGQFWGAAMVQRDGRLLLCKGYGIARRETLAPNTADSLFDMASVSKAFTGAAILRLEMAGKLSTSDPIGKHLPGTPRDKSGITIHHLLTHTSGIGEPRFESLRDERDAVVSEILSVRAARPPGEAYKYSNAGYFLLAAIIEHASGVSHDQYVRDEVMRAAGMTVGAWQGDASLPMELDTDRVDSGRSHRGLTVLGSASVCPYPMTWGYRGSGGIVTSARQMYAWDRALRGETLLDKTRIEKMFTPALDDYACGWEMKVDGVGRIASHSGSVAGYRVWFSRHLDRDASIFVVTNGSHDVKMVHDALGAALFPYEVATFRAVFRPGSYAMNEHKMVKAPERSTISAAPEGGGVVVRVKEPDAEALVSLYLSVSKAKEVVAQIRKAAARGSGKAVSASPPLDAAIYCLPYTINDGVFEVGGEGVELNVMAGTPHADADANLRISMVIQDEPRRFWPMILKIDRGMASGLADEIEAAAKTK